VAEALRDIVRSILPKLWDIQGERVRMLLHQFGAFAADLKKLSLAGVLNNYFSRASPQSIGSISFLAEGVKVATNRASWRSKVMLLCSMGEDGSFAHLRQRPRHAALSAHQSCLETFVEEVVYPETGAGGSEVGTEGTLESNP
jgi:hypothetical protein